jgi:hypothetical protein
MLEEWEKTGPRMRRSRGGTPARRMTEALSSSTISEEPHRSSRIHRRAPAFFFPTFPETSPPAAAAVSGARGGGGPSVSPAADGETAAGRAAATRGFRRPGRRRADRVRLEEEEDEEPKNGSFLPPDRFPMARYGSRGGGAATCQSTG